METKFTGRWSSFLDLLLDAVCVVDEAGRCLFASAACERIFGYTPDEMAGRSMPDMVVPEDRARTVQAAAEIMSGKPMLHFENRYMRKDGRIAHIMWTARWSDTDRVRIAVARDITERKQAEALQAALYAISEAAHAAHDLTALLQLIHRIIGTLVPAHSFFVGMADETSGELSFPYCADESNEVSAEHEWTLRAICAEVVCTGQLMLRADEDDTMPCWLAVPLGTDTRTTGALILKSDPGSARYTDGDKALLQYASTQIATSIERIRLLARLQQMAQYDDLTGLPNRSLLHDRLANALAGARREQGRMAVFYLDLDKFKDINDTLGHATGDRLLQQVAHRLKHCVRDADTVARIGGDEFVVLLPDIHLPEHALLVMDKIRSVIGEEMDITGHRLFIVPSIGLALYPEDGDNAEHLLARADEAMYRAKKRSRGIADGLAGTGL
jgi:diguanylate cyclase (GGDEF)-like protein/PAS domain S-box-containing protein